jgi:hypothetical protein
MPEQQPFIKRAVSLLIDENSDIDKSILTVVIPAFITGLGIGLRYAYEVGYCKNFGIPYEFISFELANILVTGLVVGYGVCVFITWLKFLVDVGFAKVNYWTRISLCTIAAIVLMFLVNMFFSRTIDSDSVAVITWIVIMGSFSVLIWPFRHNYVCVGLYLLLWTTIGFRTWIEKDSIWDLVATLVGSLVFASIILVLQKFFPIESQSNPGVRLNLYLPIDYAFIAVANILIFPLLFITSTGGAYVATSKTEFLVSESDPNYMLARKYGDMSFLCEFEESENGTRKLTGRIRIATPDEISNDSFVWKELGSLIKMSEPKSSVVAPETPTETTTAPSN